MIKKILRIFCFWFDFEGRSGQTASEGETYAR